jgi:hypothetical protein
MMSLQAMPLWNGLSNVLGSGPWLHKAPSAQSWGKSELCVCFLVSLTTLPCQHQQTLVVWVFYGCYNKFSQTWWLKTRKLYSLTVLEARNPKVVSPGWSQCIAGLHSFWRLDRRIHFLPLLASVGCWPSSVWDPVTLVAAFRVTLLSPLLCVGSIWPPLIRALVMTSRAHPRLPSHL